jgi:single-stranded DNA-specific DHH superfamily exonuclease
MQSKLVTVSFKIPLEDFQDYKANLRELGIYHHSEDLKNYVQGFNKHFGVEVLLNRNLEKIERLQKENKNLIKIKKEKQDALTNQAFKDVKTFIEKYNVVEGEISLPGRELIIKELNAINVRTHIPFENLMEMLEANIANFKDEMIRDELMLDADKIREIHEIPRSAEATV